MTPIVAIGNGKAVIPHEHSSVHNFDAIPLISQKKNATRHYKFLQILA